MGLTEWAAERARAFAEPYSNTDQFVVESVITIEGGRPLLTLLIWAPLVAEEVDDGAAS